MLCRSLAIIRFNNSQMKKSSFYWAIVVCTIIILILPALLTKCSTGLITFDDKSAAVATTIGDIVGPVLSFITLILVIKSFSIDREERNFRQTLDLIEKLTVVYTNAHKHFFEVGIKQQFFKGGQIFTGIIIPDIASTTPLFNVVYKQLVEGRFSSIQHGALISIFKAQIQPLVADLNEQAIMLSAQHDLGNIAEFQSGVTTTMRQLEAFNILKRYE